MKIEIEVSPGELIDRITILKIKMNKITDPTKSSLVSFEYSELSTVLQNYFAHHELEKTFKCVELFDKLYCVNLKLWDIEDVLRIYEKEQCFNESFIGSARSVYTHNDLRSALKQEINQLFNTSYKEVKQYVDYARNNKA